MGSEMYSGSSSMNSTAMRVPPSISWYRSTTCLCSPEGSPIWYGDRWSEKFLVSTTSVSPDQWPTEWPEANRLLLSGCFRPSIFFDSEGKAPLWRDNDSEYLPIICFRPGVGTERKRRRWSRSCATAQRWAGKMLFAPCTSTDYQKRSHMMAKSSLMMVCMSCKLGRTLGHTNFVEIMVI